jgi:hypothetical protein
VPLSEVIRACFRVLYPWITRKPVASTAVLGFGKVVRIPLPPLGAQDRRVRRNALIAGLLLAVALATQLDQPAPLIPPVLRISAVVRHDYKINLEHNMNI